MNPLMNLSALWTPLYLAWIVGEVAVAVLTRASSRDAKLQDRGTQILLWVVIVLSLTASGWLRHALPADLPGRHWLGPLSVVVLAAGLTVRTAAILTLGKFFSANVATRATQTIRRTGLYAVVRHPSYLGMELIFLAAGLHGHNWVALLVALIPTTIAVLVRIRVEEEALLAAFGPEYADYSRTTKRLLPGVY